MRIARVLLSGASRTAVIDADSAVHVLAPGVSVLDALGAVDHTALVAGAEAVAISEVRLLAPLDPPSFRDFSVFERHVEGIVMGIGRTVPEVWYESPFCYFSNPAAIIGPGDGVPMPPGCQELDFELEVAVVVGRAGTNLRPDEARSYIAGYTILNDWSARDLQLSETRLGLGVCKGKDFSTTLGPWVVTADEFEEHRSGDRLDVRMKASVNGRELGSDTLANMAWSFEELLSYASRGTWVRPGDVIGSGTCGSGCLWEMRGRFGGDEYPWLKPGDSVELSVDGIGSFTNIVTPGPDLIPLPPARPGRFDGATAG